MNNENEWELIFDDFKRDDTKPIDLIAIPREFYRHTVRIEVEATDIPSRWRVSGWLYHRLNSPSDSLQRDIAGEYRILVNSRQIIKLPKLTDRFYLEYLPARWYIWQNIKIWYWVKD